jgi:methionyl-tRNA formyltransferase
MSALKIVFAGTPVFAATHLAGLLDAGHDVAAVYTQPDRAAGRGKKLQASPVKQLAEQRGLPIFQPVSLKDAHAQAQLAALAPDLLIVVAYGLLLPQTVLDIPASGCINVHASLLPRWRGAAPIERAILAGDQETGVTIMQMDVGLDTGAMLYTLRTPINDSDDRVSLELRLARLGCEALLATLADFNNVRARAQIQDDTLSTYARKLDKSEALINWCSSAVDVNRTIRAGIGRHPAFSMLDNERVRFLRAVPLDQKHSAEPGTLLPSSNNDCLRIACLDSVLAVYDIQLPGKNAAPVRDILNARRDYFAVGKRFTDQENPG